MKIIKNYLYNIFYQVFILIVPLLTIPYVSRVLGASGIGINAFTNSNTQYFVLAGSIGVALYGNRQIAYVRDDRKKMTQVFWEIFFMRAVTIIVALAAFFAFLQINHAYHSAYLMQSFMIIAAAFDISWLFMGLENFKITVLRNVLVRVVSLFFIFALVKTKNDLNSYIAILSVSQLLGNLTLFPYLKRYIDLPNWKTMHIFRHFKPSVALFIPQIATQVYLVLNKTMLGQMISVEASGFYDNSDKIIKMVLAVVTATGTVMLPRVAHTFAKGDNKQVKNYLYLSFDFVTAISVPMMFGIAAIAPTFAVMFFGPQFGPVGPMMMIESIVILLIAWSNAIGVQYLLPTGHNRAYTMSVICGAIVNILLNVPLILLWKGNGAMVATVLSEFSVTLYQLVAVRKELDWKALFGGVWKYLLAGGVMFAVVFFMNQRAGGSYLHLVVEIVVGAVIYLVGILVLRSKIVGLARSMVSRFMTSRHSG